MNGLNEVQPVDGYVRMLLKNVAETHGLEIDLDRPTRAQRLEAAIAIKDVDNGWSSIEIMVGKRVDGSDPLAETLVRVQMANPDRVSNPELFYSGFGHQYFPEPSDSKE